MVTITGEMNKKKAPEQPVKATTTTRAAKLVKKSPQANKNKSSERPLKTTAGVIHCNKSGGDVTVNSRPTPLPTRSSLRNKSFHHDKYPSKMKKGKPYSVEAQIRDAQKTPAAADAGGASSSRRRFDTSSLEQRAEGLEALLELCARLFQDGKYQELEFVLKPFGRTGDVCPRETAIWFTKIINENTAPPTKEDC